MIIYNKNWLNNLHLHNQARNLFDAGCITSNELKNVTEKNPVGFYTPGPFIRTGLFILTCITVLFSFGLLSLMLSQAHVVDSFGWPLFLGIVFAVALELMTKEKNYYRAGVDDALLWMSAIFIGGALSLMLEPKGYSNVNSDHLLLCLLLLAAGIYFTLRYADLLMSAVTCFLFFATVFFAWQSTGRFGSTTMPFVIIIIAALFYLQALAVTKKLKTVYYNHCLVMAQIVGLLVLYAAGNFFVIDQMNHELNGVSASVNVQVKWAPFFWFWTMLVPVAYIVWGIFKKDVIALRVGMVLVALAIYTFRTYYHIISIELALMIGGIILLAIVYIITRYLKSPKHGFTYADINNYNTADNIKLEALLTVATFGHKPASPEEPAGKFGGGDFGGGGTGGSF